MQEDELSMAKTLSSKSKAVFDENKQEEEFYTRMEVADRFFEETHNSKRKR
jgi:hypothetical protein